MTIDLPLRRSLQCSVRPISPFFVGTWDSERDSGVDQRPKWEHCVVKEAAPRCGQDLCEDDLLRGPTLGEDPSAEHTVNLQRDL